jgi:hypothetical protein
VSNRYLANFSTVAQVVHHVGQILTATLDHFEGATVDCLPLATPEGNLVFVIVRQFDENLVEKVPLDRHPKCDTAPPIVVSIESNKVSGSAGGKAPAITGLDLGKNGVGDLKFFVSWHGDLSFYYKYTP